MPDWIAVIILGIVEGVTEFLAISSTGHLLLVERWLAVKQSDLFNIVIQTGAVLAVLPLFSARLKFLEDWRAPAARDYLCKILFAFGLTGVGGFILEKNHFKLPEELTPVAWALLVGGVLFLLVEHWLRGKLARDEVTWVVALAVGIGQLIAAVFPGASRSGTTILFMLILGLNRPRATEFSFLVSIPTMLAAGGYKILKTVRHAPDVSLPAPPENWGLVVLGTMVASVVSFAAVKWLLRYVQTHTFIAFGWYRIALGIGILVLIMSR